MAKKKTKKTKSKAKVSKVKFGEKNKLLEKK